MQGHISYMFEFKEGLSRNIFVTNLPKFTLYLGPINYNMTGPYGWGVLHVFFSKGVHLEQVND